jgi:hypothetical protein
MSDAPRSDAPRSDAPRSDAPRSDAEDTLVHAIDNLIGLYRSVERHALDLPGFSIMPALLFIWAILRFYFFFVIGIFLIVPTNLVILVRNLFPGHWRYRPFFLPHIYYVLIWLWRGEAPTAPLIFIRPLLNVFMKMHFERRLRRLRLEIVLRDELSDTMRSTLLARVDSALERWKAPRFVAAFFTALLPGIISFPSWYKNSSDALGSLGIQVIPDGVANFISQYMSADSLRILTLTTLAYLIGVPITSFLAKRGLFIGRDSDRIWFPGGQAGAGIYAGEREILSSVGIHAREAAVDLWILGILGGLNLLFLKIIVRDWMAIMGKYQSFWNEHNMLIWQTVYGISFIALVIFAAIRRQRTGRA